MYPSTSAALLTALSLLSSSSAANGNVLRKRDPPAEGYFNPSAAGGTQLTTVVELTGPIGLGEPLNVILSGNSDKQVLTGEGFMAWVNSIGFAEECLGQHIGNAQGANLGDGKGLVNETAVIRWAYGDLNLGTCRETRDGGNHFRYWNQNGTDANSGAVFMAASVEQPLSAGHNIEVPNGYDDGRDQLVGNATSGTNGTWTATGWSFTSTVEYATGLLPVGSEGINHGLSIDGRVAVITTRVTHQPEGSSGGDDSGSGAMNARSLGMGAVLGGMMAMLGLAVVGF